MNDNGKRISNVRTDGNITTHAAGQDNAPICGARIYQSQVEPDGSTVHCKRCLKRQET